MGGFLSQAFLSDLRFAGPLASQECQSLLRFVHSDRNPTPGVRSGRGLTKRREERRSIRHSEGTPAAIAYRAEPVRGQPAPCTTKVRWPHAWLLMHNAASASGGQGKEAGAF